MKSAKQQRDKALNEKQHDSNTADSVRLDKWVWAARFCKTRALARELIQGGKITYNDQRAKPSRLVELGARIKVPAGFDVKTVIVEQIKDKRQSAPLALEMYEETPDSIALRERNAQARKLSAFHSPRPDSRPDKKQRRQIIKFKNQ